MRILATIMGSEMQKRSAARDDQTVMFESIINGNKRDIHTIFDEIIDV